MRSEMNTYEKIDLYLEGKLSDQDLLEFERLISTDKALKDKIESVRIANQIVVSNKLIDLKAKMKKDMESIPYKNDSWFSNQNFWIISILGLFATGTTLYLLLHNNSTPDIVTSSIKLQKETSAPIHVSTVHNTPSHSVIEKLSNSTDSSSNSTTPTVITSGISRIATTSRTIDTKESETSPSITHSKQEPLIHPCFNTKIEAKIDVEPTCDEYATGGIDIFNIVNGTPPYVASINDGDSYVERTNFTNLLAGTYPISIKDAKGCITRLNSVTIESKKCSREKNEFAFNPELNETFIFPIEENDKGKIQILNRSGRMIYTASIPETTEWNGNSSEGSIAPSGVYIYIIELENNITKKGYVTIY